ncbi:MAG: sulfatase [Methanosarcinales archaeon]
MIIVLDTLRSHNLSTYGFEKENMPNLTQFAKEATLFKNTISTASHTAPSHLSIISGNYVDSEKMGITTTSTLTEILKCQGYLTIGVIANRAVSSKNFMRGFDIYIDSVSPYVLFKYFISFKVIFKLLYKRIFNCQFFIYHKYTRANYVNNILFPLLDKYKKENLFVFINYLDPHDPYFPKNSITKYSRYSLKNGFVRNLKHWQRPNLNEKQWENLQDLYNQELLYLDKYLGKLFNRLKRLNLWDDTIIIITSDHGELLGEKGLLGHAIALYENEIKIPMMIRYPKMFPQNYVVEDLIQTVDIVPTILETLNIKIPDGIHGKSLLSVLKETDEIKKRRFAFSLQFSYRSIRDKNWKYFRNLENGIEELYNIKNDPNELNDIAGDKQDILSQLSKTLNVYIQKYEEGQLKSTSNNDERRELLRSLGYIK